MSGHLHGGGTGELIATVILSMLPFILLGAFALAYRRAARRQADSEACRVARDR